jgi:hypothetical protein
MGQHFMRLRSEARGPNGVRDSDLPAELDEPTSRRVTPDSPGP